jgi:hypothetical protein
MISCMRENVRNFEPSHRIVTATTSFEPAVLRPRATLAAENLVLRQKLAILRRSNCLAAALYRPELHEAPFCPALHAGFRS